MTTTVQPQVKLTKITNEQFEYKLAVTTNGLYILNNTQTKIIETIVLGPSNDGYVLGTNDLNEFLDAISLIKEILLQGNNPLALFM